MHFDDKLNKIPWVAGAEKFASVRDVFTAFTSSCTYKCTYGFLFIIYKQFMSPKSWVLFQYLHAKQVKQIRYKILDIVRC